MNAVGVDVSKGRSTVAILRHMGEVVMTPEDVGHISPELKELAHRILSLGGDTRVVMEATADTILENICTGFEKSPNELLGYPVLVKADMRSVPMAVVFTRWFHTCHGLTAFPVYPGCGCTLEREFQNYCGRCGQKLDWNSYDRAAIILP